MNTRIVLSAALAAGVLFAAAPMQAQAPALSNPQKLQAKIAEQQAQLSALQAQVNALQAQIKRLQAQARTSSPTAAIVPFYKIPDLQIPDYQAPNYKIMPLQNPGLVPDPDIQGLLLPYGQSSKPQVIVPRFYSNIPPCTITLIDQKTR